MKKNERIAALENQVAWLESNVVDNADLVRLIPLLRLDISNLQAIQSHMDKRIDMLEKRMNRIDHRLDALETCATRRIEELSEQVDAAKAPPVEPEREAEAGWYTAWPASKAYWYDDPGNDRFWANSIRRWLCGSVHGASTMPIIPCCPPEYPVGTLMRCVEEGKWKGVCGRIGNRDEEDAYRIEYAEGVTDWIPDAELTNPTRWQPVSEEK
jgi:hypothetical protein